MVDGFEVNMLKRSPIDGESQHELFIIIKWTGVNWVRFKIEKQKKKVTQKKNNKNNNEGKKARAL